LGGPKYIIIGLRIQGSNSQITRIRDNETETMFPNLSKSSAVMNIARTFTSSACLWLLGLPKHLYPPAALVLCTYGLDNF